MAQTVTLQLPDEIVQRCERGATAARKLLEEFLSPPALYSRLLTKQSQGTITAQEKTRCKPLVTRRVS